MVMCVLKITNKLLIILSKNESEPLKSYLKKMKKCIIKKLKSRHAACQFKWCNILSREDW